MLCPRSSSRLACLRSDSQLGRSNVLSEGANILLVFNANGLKCSQKLQPAGRAPSARVRVLAGKGQLFAPPSSTRARPRTGFTKGRKSVEPKRKRKRKRSLGSGPAQASDSGQGRACVSTC